MPATIRPRILGFAIRYAKLIIFWYRCETWRLALRKEHTVFHTPWSRVLLEKPTGIQPVKKFPAFYGTRRFITALTSARHLSLSWANSIQSMPPHPNPWRAILILSSHLGLGLHSGFPTKTLYELLTYLRYYSDGM
jgi:hypothetical protein